MNNAIDLILFKNSLYGRKITNIGFLEHIIRFLFNIFQISQIPGISQLIQIYNPILRIFIYHQPY